MILPPALREFEIDGREVVERDIVFAPRRTLLGFGHGEFVPKVRPRLARVEERFHDKWGIARLRLEWLPLSEGEEEVVWRDEKEWGTPEVGACTWPDPVRALASA